MHLFLCRLGFHTDPGTKFHLISGLPKEANARYSSQKHVFCPWCRRLIAKENPTYVK